MWDLYYILYLRKNAKYTAYDLFLAIQLSTSKVLGINTTSLKMLKIWAVFTKTNLGLSIVQNKSNSVYLSKILL